MQSNDIKEKAVIYGVLLVVVTFLITSTLNIALGGKVVISKETYEAYKNIIRWLL